VQPLVSQRHWAMRLAARTYVALVLALCVVAALSLVHGQPVQAAVALAALAADFVGLGALVAGIVVCLLADAPVAALLATAILGTRLVGRAGARLGAERRRRDGVDLEALAADTTLPDELREKLQGAAADGSPVTTRTILAAAVAADPGRWRPLLGIDPGENAFDGAPIVAADGVECSQFAAEALGFGRVLAERLHRPLGVELLGACAGLIPGSAAAEWLDDEADKEDMVRATAEQLATAMVAFSETAAGTDLVRRVEAASRPESPML
jgi:hypothetical protein